MIALWDKIKLWAIGIAVAGTAISAAFWRAREDGKNALLIEQQRKRDAQQAEFDRIDADAPDVNASLERLRRRSGGK